MTELTGTELGWLESLCEATCEDGTLPPALTVDRFLEMLRLVRRLLAHERRGRGAWSECESRPFYADTFTGPISVHAAIALEAVPRDDEESCWAWFKLHDKCDNMMFARDDL